MRSRGFTLLELMVVVLIVGTILLIVPPNLSSWGARSRLDSTANSLVAAMAGAREQAIFDGYEVSLDIGTWRDQDGEHRQGYRFRYTNIPPPSASKLATDASQLRDNARERSRERQWLFSDWYELGSGVRYVGFSEEPGIWERVSRDEEPHRMRFFADGSVEKAFAIRIESTDLDVKAEERTVTVVMNALTSDAAARDGLVELPRMREAGEFRR
jgi:prepilin-type N-terminal cleavage/methylation domain-containing protein